MSIDDQPDLYERLDREVRAIPPPMAPVDRAMRRGRAIRLRRRAALVAGVVAVVGAGLVAVPSLRHAATEHPAPSYSATVRSPGQHSPPGLIASGTVNGQRWQIVAGRPGAGWGPGQQIFLATGPALDSGSASASVSAAAWKSKDPVVFLGLPCPPTQVQFGRLRADVSSVKVRLGNGSTLTLHPATVWGVRMVAFAIPMGAPVVSATAYSAHGGIATAIPWNEPGQMAAFALWLRPGQHGPARVSGVIGSGSYQGSAWSATAHVGPWGVCVEAEAASGSGASTCTGATSSSGLGTNTMLWSDGPTAVAIGSAGTSVARIVVTAPDGKTTTVHPAAVGGFRFFAFPLGPGPRTWKWTAYDSSGHMVRSDKVTPGS